MANVGEGGWEEKPRQESGCAAEQEAGRVATLDG